MNGNEIIAIDVRERIEFFLGHHKGAINIPLSKLSNKIDDLKAMKGTLLLYCRTGVRSNQAVMYLRSLGFNNVYNGGGLKDIKSAILEMCKTSED
jgi:rhodanese-related sulfurtransferase